MFMKIKTVHKMPLALHLNIMVLSVAMHAQGKNLIVKLVANQNPGSL